MTASNGISTKSSFLNFKELYFQLNLEDHFLAKHYFFWFLLRRFILIMSLIFLTARGYLQVFVAVLLSLIEIVILFRLKPFKHSADNRINILNEVFLLSIYGLLVSLEHFDDTSD